jgi:hypothetical protein
VNYLSLIWADGRPSPDELKVMQRELPIWDQQPAVAAVRLFGRELELPQEAATVRVRGGETIVTDGPFAETKEFIAGFDLLQCADSDQAIGFAVECPISRFQPIEVRPFDDSVELDERAHAFGRGEDAADRPFLICPWVDRELAGDAAADELHAWRGEMQGRGVLVLGQDLAGPEQATTVRAGELTPGPFTRIPEVMVAIDVVSCADRAAAVELAASHPMARAHAIEVRPFYVEEDH